MNPLRALAAALLSLAVAVLVAPDALACVIVEPHPVPVVRRPPRPQQPLETHAHTADIRIRGPVAEVSVDAVFYNPNPYVMEGTYFFPLAAQAAVDDFQMNINGRMVKGELLDSDKARGIYEDIVRKMKDPGLLEFVGTKMLKCRVYPMNPRSETRVKLTYTVALEAEGGLYAFTYPLRSARPEAGKIGTCALRVRVEQPRGIKTVYCPSHEVDVVRDGEQAATLGFEKSGLLPERDFKLYFGVSEKDIGVGVLTHKPSGEDGYFLLTVSPKVEVSAAEVESKSIVFVMDTSGSMAGEKIRQAKGALRYCVRSLKAKDRFGLVAFSTEPRAFREELAAATEENVAAAVEFIEGLEARGGTAIDAALGMALKTVEGAKGLPMVVFLTDGLPTIGETSVAGILKNAAEANAAKARLFVFGVGYDVNTKLLDQLAEDNGGTPDYVTPKEDIEVKVSSFYQKVSSPVLSDVELSIPGLATHDVYPKAMPDLFRGMQLMVLGRFEGGGHKAVKLTGTVGGAKREFVYEARFAETASHGFLPRLWATRKVAYLLDEIRLHGKSDELVDEVVRLGKRYGIMTPYTSFLVVEDAERPQLAARMRGAAGRFDRAEKGAGAVHRAMDLRRAKEEATAKPKPNAPAAVGFAGDEAEALREVAAERIVTIAEKTFYRKPDGLLVDSDYDEEKHKDQLVEVEAFSQAYFDLVKAHPDIGRYLAEGKPMVLVFEGEVYKITTAD
ncbi:MAG: VIT domain-containing protein [Candidatus Brocadiia bacterium]